MPNFEHPEYPEATLLHLESMVPCRESQVSSLLSVFGKRQHFSFPSIFIYGHTSSGKTYVMQTVLETLELPHVFVNCIECFTSRLLLEEVLTQLQKLSSEKKHGFHVPCDTFNDFVRLFKQETITQDLQNQTLYIVLDKAEQLREMEANVLPGFLRLQEFTDRNVTVIFLSEIVWELFRPNTGCLEPLTLYFPDYSIGHLQKILSHYHPPEYSADFYAAYINILLGVFYTVCRDLKELRHLAALNFTKYCEPVVRGEASERDTRRLWKNIESHLKKAMQTVYLREISRSCPPPLLWKEEGTEGLEGQRRHIGQCSGATPGGSPAGPAGIAKGKTSDGTCIPTWNEREQHISKNNSYEAHSGKKYSKTTENLDT